MSARLEARYAPRVERTRTAWKRSKCWLVGGYWAAQTLCVYFVTPLVLVSATNVSANTGDMGSVRWAEYVKTVTDREWLTLAAIIIGALTAAQLIFVFPVRRPAPARSRGTALGASLGLAGLGVGVLSGALVLAVACVVQVYELLGARPLVDTGAFDPGWIIVGWCLVSWAVATPLLIRFCRRGPREALLGRLSSRLFVGTVVEVTAIIPLDVMVRRRADCHCGSGTFIGLLMCASVGIFALGPAVFLPVLARRRRRWYEGKCEGCGYDMSPTPRAPCCPECGLGWRADSPEPHQAPA